MGGTDFPPPPDHLLDVSERDLGGGFAQDPRGPVRIDGDRVRMVMPDGVGAKKPPPGFFGSAYLPLPQVRKYLAEAIGKIERR